jgi:hypothetical protein
MSSLQKLLETRRAEQPAEPQLCHAIHPQANALTVITSADEKWIFPWHHLASAHLTRVAGREHLRLTFTAQNVTLHGRNLGVLADLVATMQLAVLRVAPARYAKGAESEPFIEGIHVANHEAEDGPKPA